MCELEPISPELLDVITRDKPWNTRIFALLTLAEEHGVDLNLDSLRHLALAAGVSPMQVWREFDEWMRLSKEAGLIRICDNITCLAKGAGALRKLAAQYSGTTYSFEYVKCLGGCTQGPCITWKGKLLGGMTPQKLLDIMEHGAPAPDGTEGV